MARYRNGSNQRTTLTYQGHLSHYVVLGKDRTALCSISESTGHGGDGGRFSGHHSVARELAFLLHTTSDGTTAPLKKR
jgi:hypothetical protein